MLVSVTISFDSADDALSFLEWLQTEATQDDFNSGMEQPLTFTLDDQQLTGEARREG